MVARCSEELCCRSECTDAADCVTALGDGHGECIDRSHDAIREVHRNFSDLRLGLTGQTRIVQELLRMSSRPVAILQAGPQAS